MRSCCALYVDAGYLLASAATRVTGTSLRSGLRVEHDRLIHSLVRQVEADSGLPLLRVHWYDSGSRPGGQPGAEQTEIGLLPRVKLRLGRLSFAGEQKGVDLRLGLDLVTHARNRIVDVVYLLSGDDDLTEAVEEAQGHGVQVILLGVPNAAGTAHAVARHLQREADGLILIGPDTIDDTVRRATPPAAEGTGAVGFPHPTEPTELRESGRPAEAASAEAASADASSATTRAAAPSPADLATRQRPLAGGPGRRSPRPTPPASRPVIPPVPLVAYTTTTGEPPRRSPEPALDEGVAATIEEVCRSVIGSWARSASDDERAALFAGRPQIPSEIDRALLLDLAARLGVDEIEEPDRFALRARFWDLAGSLRTA